MEVIDGLNNNLFYHYTSLDVALKIILSEQLWLNNRADVNDLEEFQTGVNIIRDICSQQSLRNKRITPTLKRLFSVMSPPAAYLVCFCARDNNQHLWNDYAQKKTGKGAILGFDALELHKEFANKERNIIGGQLEDEVFIFNVNYNTNNFIENTWRRLKKIKKLGIIPNSINTISELNKIKHFKKNRDIFADLWADAMLLKNDIWAKEEEWRIVHFPSPTGPHKNLPPTSGNQVLLDLSRCKKFPIKTIITSHEIDLDAQRLLAKYNISHSFYVSE